MSTALTVLAVMVICTIGLASIMAPIIAFMLHLDKPTKGWQVPFGRARWWLIPVPFIVIPLLVLIATSAGLLDSSDVDHCGPGTRYVQLGKNADPGWMCMGVAQ